MQPLDTTPGLSAWEHRRSKRLRRMIGHAILATGLSGAALWAMPPDMNPLVSAGIIANEQKPIEPHFPRITIAIPVRDVDLPKQRPTLPTQSSQPSAAPSLGAALDRDRTEAAFIARHTPVRATALIVEEPEAIETSSNLSGFGLQMHAIQDSAEPPASPPPATPIAAALPSSTPQPPPPKVSPKRAAGTTGPDEDFADLKKRAFTVER